MFPLDILDMLYGLIAYIMTWCFSLYEYLEPYLNFFGYILGLLAFSLFLRFIVFPFIDNGYTFNLQLPMRDNRKPIQPRLQTKRRKN